MIADHLVQPVGRRVAILHEPDDLRLGIGDERREVELRGSGRRHRAASVAGSRTNVFGPGSTIGQYRFGYRGPMRPILRDTSREGLRAAIDADIVASRLYNGRSPARSARRASTSPGRSRPKGAWRERWSQGRLRAGVGRAPARRTHGGHRRTARSHAVVAAPHHGPWTLPSACCGADFARSTTRRAWPWT